MLFGGAVRGILRYRDSKPGEGVTVEAFRQFFDTTSSTFTYLLVDPVTRDAVIIDPVDTHLNEYLDADRAR